MGIQGIQQSYRSSVAVSPFLAGWYTAQLNPDQLVSIWGQIMSPISGNPVNVSPHHSTGTFRLTTVSPVYICFAAPYSLASDSVIAGIAAYQNSTGMTYGIGWAYDAQVIVGANSFKVWFSMKINFEYSMTSTWSLT